MTITYDQIHDFEEATKMNIRYQLDQLGADEYNLTYQPFSGPGCGWSLRFKDERAGYIEVCATTIQGCIDQARSQITPDESLFDQLTEFVAKVSETFSEPDLGVVRLSGDVIGFGLYTTGSHFTFLEIDPTTNYQDAVRAITEGLPEWGFS